MMTREMDEYNWLIELEQAFVDMDNEGYTFNEFELSMTAMIQERISVVMNRINEINNIES